MVQQIEKVRFVGELVIVLMAIYFILKVFWINTEFVMTTPPNQIKYWTILDYIKASWCMIASPAGQQLVRRQTIVLRFNHIWTGCARIHLSWVESVHAEHGSLSFQGCLSHLMRSCPGCSIFFQPKPWEIVLATRGRVCLNFIKASYHYSSVSRVAFSAFMVPRMLLFRYNSYNSIYGAIFRFRFGFSKIMISIFSIVTSLFF